MNTKGIRDAIYALCAGVTPITNTTYNVASHVPLQRVDYEGFVVFCSPPSVAWQPMTTSQLVRVIPAWQILLLSPSLSRLDPKALEDAMMDYGDALRQALFNAGQVDVTEGNSVVAYPLEFQRDYYTVPYTFNGNDHYAWTLEFTLSDATINKEC